jgi:hypothetical protein
MTVQLLAPGESLEPLRPAIRLVLRDENDPAFLDDYRREMLDLLVIELLVTDHAGRRGLLLWDEPLGGGGLTMRWGEAGWEIGEEFEVLAWRCGYAPW